MINMDELRHRRDHHDGLAVDVAIIGAGVSGLYSGFRLLQGRYRQGTPRPSSVHVFDMGERVGGRLHSIELPRSSVIGELGGMRYMTSQEIVNALIEDVLELDSVDFPLGDPARHVVYLRKERFRANAWAAAQAEGGRFDSPYRLPEELVGFSANQLLNKVVYDVLEADPSIRESYGELATRKGPFDYRFHISRKQWNEIKPALRYCFPGSPYDGMRLADMGFWNLIRDRVGNEGYELIAAGGGYFSNTINWNAAEAFPYMVGDFTGSEIEFRTLSRGFDELPRGLAEKYLEDDSATLWMGNRLCNFSRSDGEYRYRLHFFNEDSGEDWSVQANAVILAMPQRSIELLDQENFFFDQDRRLDLQRGIASVIRQPSFKLLMGFEKPWWSEHLGAHAGESITDLPLRQCYYFGVDPENGHSLFLASYNDMRTVPFWNVLAGENGATDVMVSEALNQVAELHDLDPDEIGKPYVAFYKDWSADPFGGGYHAWHAGVDVRHTMPFMRRPDPDEAVHICGEAWSDQQGWVEGAFCVAENMLQDWFGLEWPSEWLREGYYLGW